MTTTTLPTSISYVQTYIALAMLLPPDLRTCATCAGLCHLEVVRPIDAECYLVHVAALPQYLDISRSKRVFTVLLTANQIAQALLYDHALQSIPTCDLREMVELHVLQVCGTVSTVEEKPNSEPPPKEQEEEMLVPVELFVSTQTVANAIEVVDVPAGKGASKHRRRMMLQYIWLQAAIMMMRRQAESAKRSYKGKLYAIYSEHYQYLCRIFAACHRSRQEFACARPVYIEGQQVGWHLVVGIPASLMAA